MEVRPAYQPGDGVRDDHAAQQGHETMSAPQRKKQNQVKLARLEIVAGLYKRGYSYRKIQEEVMKRLGLETYGLRTVHADVQSLLKEWREGRLENMDYAIQLELERIDDTIAELWEQWEKSKQNYTKTSSKRKGAPVSEKGGSAPTIKTVLQEKSETEVVSMGDVSYIAEIRQQLVERRKILGLYAPELREVKEITEFDLSGLTPEQKAVLQQIGERALDEAKN